MENNNTIFIMDEEQFISLSNDDNATIVDISSQDISDMLTENKENRVSTPKDLLKKILHLPPMPYK